MKGDILIHGVPHRKGRQSLVKQHSRGTHAGQLQMPHIDSLAERPSFPHHSGAEAGP